MKKRKNKIVDRLIKGVKDPGNIFLLSLLIITLVILKANELRDRKKLFANPYETTAEILRIKPCFKNGKCMDFQYIYNGVTYKSDASISWEFALWCEKRNHCRGKSFRILLQKDDPENILVYWQEMYVKAKEDGE